MKMEKELSAKPPAYTEDPLKPSVSPLYGLVDPDRRKKSLLFAAIFIILVLTLACFAIFTVVSTSSAEKGTGLKEALTGNVGEGRKNHVKTEEEVKPNFRFAVFVNGKPALTGGSGEMPADLPAPKEIFSPISEILKKLEKENEQNKDESKSKETESSTTDLAPIPTMPRTIKTETWTIRRIPLDGKPPQVTTIKTTSSPLGDPFGPAFPWMSRRLTPEHVMFPFNFFRKLGESSSRSVSSEEDRKLFPKSPFDDLKNVMNMFDMLESKMRNDVMKESREKEDRPFVRIIPLSIKRVRFFPSERASAEVFPKSEKPEKYKAKSEGSLDFFNKFLGRPKASDENNTAPKSLFENRNKMSPLFQNFLDPFWPTLHINIRPKSGNLITALNERKENNDSKKIVLPSNDISPVQKSAEQPAVTVTTPQPTTPSTPKGIVTDISPNSVTTLSPNEALKIVE